MHGNLFANPAGDIPGDSFTAHCDGGSRGNPGPAGYGAVVEDAQGRVVAQLSEYLGIQTNNFAEYSGLLGVLRWAVEHNVGRLRVISDSELMVKQMQGKYAVKSPILRPLFEEARKLSRRIESFEMRHTLRGGNKEADRLANEAMDKGMGKSPSAPLATPAARASSAQASSQAPRPAPPAPKPTRQVLEGYVKNGVVHLLEGELPDGIFVKVIRE
ncbi:MAG: ribonuclease HI family protein [Terracidiphilus sp.]|jgi:probable phosphoglycerate mutase